MQRSVYSLVLMEEVIEQIDEMAYTLHTSRSNLINRILAEHVSYITPEKRCYEIFGRLMEAFNEKKEFHLQAQPQTALLTMQRPLPYKYRPVVRYYVELYQKPGQIMGELRVHVRTQSQQLLADMGRFSQLWEKLEAQYLAPVLPSAIEYQEQPGKFCRKLYMPQNADMHAFGAIAQSIEQYITIYDDSMHCYFAHLEDATKADKEVRALYAQYKALGLPVI